MNVLSASAELQSSSPLSVALVRLRRGLGYKSARSFYVEYLQRRTRLEFNYSYYMKIEGARILPSPQIVSQLCEALEADAATQRSRFRIVNLSSRSRRSCFNAARKNRSPHARRVSVILRPSGASAASHLRQKFLTPAQVAGVGQSKFHYYAFLMLTMARTQISQQDVAEALGEKEIAPILKSLERLRLIRIDGEKVETISQEMRFPDPTSPKEKKLRELLESWNLTFPVDMNFEPLLTKMLVRRVSSRYLSVILSHCNVLLDLIRAADEANPEFNEDVLMFKVSLQQGKLPG